MQHQPFSFSLEWSRIQPGEDLWDPDAAAHYQEMVDILRQDGIEPMVTLHHFTHPLWVIRKTWHDPASIGEFLDYTERVVSTLKDVKCWITFNEPYVLILGGCLEG